MPRKRVYKVIILGCLDPSMFPIEAPIDDDTYEVWAINNSWDPPRWDRWFQLHGVGYMLHAHGSRYLKWLRTVSEHYGKKVYVFPEWRDHIPGSVGFPANDLVKRFGDYFTGSFAWLVAYAHWRGANVIWLNPGSMKGEEWAIPCIEYHIGIAKAAGIVVHVDEASGLLDRRGGLYGIDEKLGNEGFEDYPKVFENY